MRSLRRAAVSLAETVAAATILALTIAFVVNLLPSSVLSVRLAENKLRAGQLAQNVLEESRQDFAGLPLGGPVALPTVQEGAATFQLSREVLPVSDIPGGRLKLVKVTVSWTERKVERRVTRQLTVADVRF
ncbi:MAG: hypothetical protein AB1758_22110 [Candidatus Eremiobacterota bacterium]